MPRPDALSLADGGDLAGGSGNPLAQLPRLDDLGIGPQLEQVGLGVPEILKACRDGPPAVLVRSGGIGQRLPGLPVTDVEGQSLEAVTSKLHLDGEPWQAAGVGGYGAISVLGQVEVVGTLEPVQHRQVVDARDPIGAHAAVVPRDQVPGAGLQNELEPCRNRALRLGPPGCRRGLAPR